MQYSVPQFIDVEDKIIGPLTIKQFIYVIAGAGVLFMLWTVSPSIEVFLLPAIPVLGIFLALAFYKINGRPFSTFLQSALSYLGHPKVLIWNRIYDPKGDQTNIKLKVEKGKEKEETHVGQHVTESRLRKLSQVLDNEGGVDETVFDVPDSSELSPYEKQTEVKDTDKSSKVARERRVEELLGRK